MPDALDPLVIDLVEWVAVEPRRYADVIDRWRTSCPRLTVWEDALDRGFLQRTTIEGQGTLVIATASGRAFLRAHNRMPDSSEPVRTAQAPDRHRSKSRRARAS